MNQGEAQVLDNGRYRVRIADAGGGQSSLDGIALNRWAGDPLQDAQGCFIYLRDAEDDALWSSTLQPTLIRPERYEVQRGTDRFSVTREDRGIVATTTVSLVEGLDAEQRSLRLHNASGRRRTIEVTSFTEIALAHAAGDLAHPAFSKLFVQTAFVQRHGALLARRRPRAAGEPWPLAFHVLLDAPLQQWETDRVRFIGRGRSAENPQLRMERTTGNVLDPVFALRSLVELAPGEERELRFVLGFAANRPKAIAALRRLGAGPAQAPRAAAPRVRNRMRGAFERGGAEYAMRLPWNGAALDLPPMPWVNVIANPRCGCIVSETGAGYTWCRNSQANRLTPWSNDPVSDPHGEALYLRDEDDGAFWSPLPGPAPAPARYEARHGFGYSRFRLRWSELEHEVAVSVARHDPVKCVTLRLRNRGPAPRRLSLYACQRLVMGSQPAAAGAIRSWRRGAALCAANDQAGDFAGGIAFSTLVAERPLVEETGCDRRAFIGANGSLRAPAALRAASLDGAVGADLDPCFARRAVFVLAPGEALSLHLLLGGAMGEAELEQMLSRYADPAAIEAEREAALAQWRDSLGAIRVRTPVPAIDHMLNGWLPYQALSCRIWGRSAFYQSGGAYGYRDQLQDAGNLAPLWPQLTREQILLHAAHQFSEGDVLHWWHPQPLERGLRTRFSDDLLWLPYVAAGYVAQTGDAALLDEAAPFLSAPALEDGHDEAYLKPRLSGESDTVYEHCCRALDRSLTRGAHGLPLMGCGDWNDGMNRVGREGRGESVWLGFFLVAILDAFIPLARARDDERAGRYAAYRKQLEADLNLGGWDGGWFRRAYYDDGTPMGTHTAAECRIDGLAQAWAVLSGAAAPGRGEQAMRAAREQLVAERDGLLRLLTPPFVETPQDPGYIKGYVAGIRENGGQYTHAACWMIAAAARLGWREEAVRWLERISPQWHDAHSRRRYQVEPYVIAADIYGARPHVGRGGWTWYTGAAGWAWRVGLEYVLGLRLEQGHTLVVAPCIPDTWPAFEVEYRLPGSDTVCHLRVVNPDGAAARVVTATLDGAPVPVEQGVARLLLSPDGRRHAAVVTLGAA